MTVADQPPKVDRFEGDPLGTGVEARDLHQVVHERPQPADVGDQQLAGAPALRRQRAEVLAHDRRLGDECGERGPQLVRDVGHETPVLGLGRLEPGDRVGQRLGHPVEAVGPRPELVVRGDRHARRQVAALDPLGGATRGFDRGQDAAGDDPRHEQGDQRSGRASRRPAPAGTARAPPRARSRRGRSRTPARRHRPGHRPRGSAGRRPSSRRRPARPPPTAVAQVGRERRRRPPSSRLARDGHAVRHRGRRSRRRRAGGTCRAGGCR